MSKDKFIILALAVLVSSASLCDARTHEKTWGVGYDKHYSSIGGLTIRRWLGPDWELGVSAAPMDASTDRRTWSWGDDVTEDEAIEEIPDDDTRESGWIRMLLGRRLLRQDDLDLMFDLGLKYWWADSRNYSRYYYEYSERTTINVTDIFDDEWVLSLDLRPSYDLSRRMSIEARFGLKFTWSDERRDTLRREIEGTDIEDVFTASTTEYRSFNSYGWSGLGSLSFLFWF